jgi:Mrp family chromosome partitioning ATPase
MPAEPPAAESPVAESAARSLSSGLLKNRFQEPARQAAVAASLEDDVERSLSDPQLAAPYRRLAGSLAGQYPGEVPAVLLLTAPMAHLRIGETLMHLAALLAEPSPSEDGARVLVVDASLAEKSLSSRMQASGKPGLAEVLGRRKGWRDYVTTTARERVDFLPAGEGPVTSYKSIGSKLAPLLDEWKDAYRYVLLDAGAAAEPLTEPLAQACDATYLHVSLSDTDAAVARNTAERLRAAGARLRGCVVES